MWKPFGEPTTKPIGKPSWKPISKPIRKPIWLTDSQTIPEFVNDSIIGPLGKTQKYGE